MFAGTSVATSASGSTEMIAFAISGISSSLSFSNVLNFMVPPLLLDDVDTSSVFVSPRCLDRPSAAPSARPPLMALDFAHRILAQDDRLIVFGVSRTLEECHGLFPCDVQNRFANWQTDIQFVFVASAEFVRTLQS